VSWVKWLRRLEVGVSRTAPRTNRCTTST
jgi:hypothetical protein